MARSLISVLDTTGIICSFLDSASYHNFYFQFEELFLPQKERNNIITDPSIPQLRFVLGSRIGQCHMFMKYNKNNISYAQAIASIYCSKTRNWNKDDEHKNYYNNVLGSNNIVPFKNPLLAIKILDEHRDEQTRIERSVLYMNTCNLSFKIDNTIEYSEYRLLPLYSECLKFKNDINWFETVLKQICECACIKEIKLQNLKLLLENLPKNVSIDNVLNKKRFGFNPLELIIDKCKKNFSYSRYYIQSIDFLFLYCHSF